MITDIRSWGAQFSQLLKGSFGERLRFVGYQGSYARGEATQSSDVDIVAVLDHVDTDDLDVYRELVGSMEQGELACGFLCGEGELRGWPLYDLYTLWLDTKPVLGDLTPLLPPLNRRNAWEALQVGAANLYHAACHTYLTRDLVAPCQSWENRRFSACGFLPCCGMERTTPLMKNCWKCWKGLLRNCCHFPEPPNRQLPFPLRKPAEPMAF